jgi:hypothetical protein
MPVRGEFDLLFGRLLIISSSAVRAFGPEQLPVRTANRSRWSTGPVLRAFAAVEAHRAVLD